MVLGMVESLTEIFSQLGDPLDVLNELFVPCDVAVQICDRANKFLVAVSKMDHAGNQIVFFDDDGAHRICGRERWGVKHMVVECEGVGRREESDLGVLHVAL